jgi:hypothetical protein
MLGRFGWCSVRTGLRFHNNGSTPAAQAPVSSWRMWTQSILASVDGMSYAFNVSP